MVQLCWFYRIGSYIYIIIFRFQCFAHIYIKLTLHQLFRLFKLNFPKFMLKSYFLVVRIKCTIGDDHIVFIIPESLSDVYFGLCQLTVRENLNQENFLTDK